MSPYYLSDNQLYPFLVEHYPFPPFFPTVLAMLGGGNHAALPSYLSNVFIMVLALWFYYLWSKSVLDSRVGGLAALVLVAFMPNTISQLLVVQSEPLFLLLTMSGFWLMQRAHSARHDYITAILFALASITRTIGVLAVLVYLIKYWSIRSWRARIMTALVALMPVLLWSVYRQFHGGGDGYAGILLAGFEGNIIDNLSSQLKVNVQLMWLYWVRCFDTSIALHSRYVLSVITAIIGLGFIVRLFKGHADAQYTALYLLVLLVWPYPAQFERFIFLLMPFALVYGLFSISLLKDRVTGKAIPLFTSVYVIAITLVMLPTLAGMALKLGHDGRISGDQARSIEWLQSHDWQNTKQSQQFMARVYHFMQKAQQQVPEDSCVISTVPAYFMLHSNRKSIKPAHMNASDMEFEGDFRECDYVFMLSATPKPSVGNPPMYPFQRIKDKMIVLDLIYWDAGNSDSDVAAMLARIKD
jgi:hypothetical protein